MCSSPSLPPASTSPASLSLSFLFVCTRRFVQFFPHFTFFLFCLVGGGGGGGRWFVWSFGATDVELRTPLRNYGVSDRKRRIVAEVVVVAVSLARSLTRLLEAVSTHVHVRSFI